MDKVKKKEEIPLGEVSSFEQMKAFASVYCVRQEQYTRFIRQKLKKKFNASENDIEGIVKWLKSVKVLDDLKFSNAFVHDKTFLNKWGINKTVAGLRYRNISDEIIMKAVMGIDQEKYFNVAKSVFDEIAKTEKDRMKITKKMVSRGFQYSVISQLLNDKISI
jgi:SOS response regulatory protein OraA/RecX